MSAPRRLRAAIGLALVAAVAAVVLAGPRLARLAGQVHGAASDAAPTDDALGLDRRWVAPVTGWPSALVADTHGAVVVAGGGEIRALARDGATRWRVDVAGAGFHPPAIAARTAVVGAGGRVVALDRADGSQQWESPVADGAAGPVTVAGSVVVYGTEAGALGALDTRTGAVRWTVAYPGAVGSAPAVAARDGVVVAAWHGGGHLRAFDLLTGAVRWEAPLARFASAPVVHRGVAVVGEGDGEGRARVVARHLGDGREAWAARVPASFESGITPAAAGRDLAIVDHFGGFTLLDARDGRVRHRVELHAPVLRTTLVIAGPAVALTTHGGELVLVDRRSGRVRHRADPGGYPVAVAVAGRSDLLVALRIRGPGRVESLRVA